MAENLFRSPSRLPEGLREQLLGHQSHVLWFTGLSGSGKSTVARALEVRLMGEGHLAYILDGDNVRLGLNRDLGFSEEDREENLRRVAEVARLISDAGAIVIVAFISPLRRSRERAREIIGEDRFSEVYLSTPLEACEARDVKGLYAKARAGEIHSFTGIDSPFEAPLEADLELDTSRTEVADSVSAIHAMLARRGVLGVPEASTIRPN